MTESRLGHAIVGSVGLGELARGVATPRRRDVEGERRGKREEREKGKGGKKRKIGTLVSLVSLRNESRDNPAHKCLRKKRCRFPERTTERRFVVYRMAGAK